MIIAIDGPSLSGKSSVARLLAQALGCYHLDTGLLYRGLAYSLQTYKKYEQGALRSPLHQDIREVLFEHLKYTYGKTGGQVWYKQIHITPYLKSVACSNAASLIAKHKQVRDAMLQFQRRIVAKHHVVADGRDVGTVVFPQADYKFFIIADIQVRAERLVTFRKQAGEILSFDQAYSAVQSRDKQDTQRQHSPLRQAEDAHVVDSSHLSLDQVVQYIMAVVQPEHSI